MTVTAQVSIRIKDGQGRRGSTRAYVQFPDAATITQLNTGLGGWLTALNNVTGGVIEEAVAHVLLDISGLTPNTPSGAILIQEGVGMSFPAVLSTQPWDFVVPARAIATVSGNKAVVTEGGLVDLLTDIMGNTFTVIASNDSNFADEDGARITLEPYCFPSTRKVGKAVRGPNRSLGV